jgi:hypothetical protein
VGHSVALVLDHLALRASSNAAAAVQGTLWTLILCPERHCEHCVALVLHNLALRGLFSNVAGAVRGRVRFEHYCLGLEWHWMGCTGHSARRSPRPQLAVKLRYFICTVLCSSKLELHPPASSGSRTASARRSRSRGANSCAAAANSCATPTYTAAGSP